MTYKYGNKRKSFTLMLTQIQIRRKKEDVILKK